MNVIKIAAIVILSILAFGSGIISFLPNQRTYTKKDLIKADIETVFRVVSDLKGQQWRSNIGKIEILDSTPSAEVWTETPNRGPQLKFRTKTINKPHLFVIEIIDNPQFGGQWIGRFSATSEGKTEIEFTETVLLNGFIAKMFSYLFFNLEKVVDTYIEDLKTFVEN